jgi:Na+-driven multidrug efflux pump
MLDDMESYLSLENKALKDNKKEVIQSLEVQNQFRGQEVVLMTTEECSFRATFKKIIVMGGSMLVAMMLLVIRYFMLFLFSRSYGIAQLEALGAVIPAYSIMTIGTSWSSTQGYGFKSAEYAARKEFRNLGLVTNKSILYNLSIGCLMFVILFFFGGMIFSKILDNPLAVQKVDVIFKFISIGTPLQFWQMVSNRYFCATNKPLPLLIGSIIGFIVQILSLLFFVTYLGHVDAGIGLSFSLATASIVLFNVINYIYYNPNPSAVVTFRWDETLDGFWDFIVYSAPVGLIVFLSMISLDLMPFLSLIVSDTTFACYGVIESIFMLTYIFGEAIALANNVQLNFAKGTKNFKYMYTILYASLSILGIYIVLSSTLLLIFFRQFLSLYTTDSTVVRIISGMKPMFIISQAMLTLHSTMSESISSLGHVYYPIYTLFGGRYILVIVLTFAFAKSAHLGADSVITALMIGLTLTNIANVIYLFYAVKLVEKGEIELKIE